jgi:hypothetical protein
MATAYGIIVGLRNEIAWSGKDIRKKKIACSITENLNDDQAAAVILLYRLYRVS